MKNILIIIAFLLPISVSAQLLRAYGVVEIGATFPTSTSTGAKFAYRVTDSSFYRWQHTNVWVKIIPDTTSGGADTLYLQQISGTTAIVNGDTINLTPYILKTDTASILAPYIKLAGWGLAKLTSTLQVDTSKVATRYYASTLPTLISANYIATSNGTNLVARNLFDNNTYVGVLNNKPFSLGQWTTAGRPSGTSGYMGWNTTLTGLDWYNGTRWATGLESTFARGTATYVPFFDANGQITQGVATGQGLRYYNAGGNLHILEAKSAFIAQGVTGINSGNADLATRTATGNGYWSFSANESTGAFSFYDAISNQTPVTIAKNSGANRITTNSTTTTLSSTTLLSLTSATVSAITGSNTLSAGSLMTDALASSQASFRTVNGSNILSWSPFSTSPYFAISNGTQQGYFQATTLDGIRFGALSNHPLILNTNATARIYITGAGRTGLAKAAPDYIFDVTSTDAYGLPRGTVAQRPTIAASTTPFRYNTDSTALEYGESVGTWRQLATRSYARSLVSALPTTNIYTANGTLTSHRTVTSGGFDLTMTGKVKIGSDSSFVHNPGQDTTYLKGTLRIKTGFLNLQNETGGAYINIQAQGSGNKEAGILMESRGSFGNVLYINGESLSTLGVYNFDKVGGGGFNVLIGESPGFTGMASIGDFIVTDSTSNSAGSGRRFKLDSRGDARFYDYGTGNKQATDLGKAQSNYVTGFATDGTVVEIEGLHVDSTELVIFDSYTASAPFTPNAVGEEASELFLTTSATTGKVLQRKMRETSWTNSNASITDDMLELAQDVFMYANCPFAASDSTVIDLPTPSSDYIGQVVEVCGDGRSPTYNVYVRGVGATLWHQNGGADPSAQTYLEVTNLSSNHNTVKFICAQPSGSTYYWILLKQQ